MFETVLHPISTVVSSSIEMLKSPISPTEAGATKRKSLSSATVTVDEVVEPSDQHTAQTVDLNALAFDLNATHIQSSPYDDPVNFLKLQELSIQNRLFALALTRLRSTRPDYATAPYMESFDWPATFSILRTLCVYADVQWQRQEFYLVIFRSKLRQDADRDRLGLLDKNSHEEACASGGLLTYWFGRTDSEMQNLATCIWRNREDASAGGKGPWHRKARGAAREMYENISFYTHRFVVDDGASNWWLQEYHD